jgi:hypothetical protein
MSGPITKEAVASDLDTLLQLSNPLSRLLNPSTTTSSTAQRSSLYLLEEYTPSTTDHDASQALAETYVRDMRGNVLSIDRGEGEKLGVRIDEIRGKAEGVVSALGDVKV